ncbi:molybdopterin molybdotransferase MoeA [Rhizobiaceae bacterium BDR2-2]|uniref:Molybdopterin molybdenumtransferase n=1 Tax=Ectorhizobium quercum TaxID=2965071 RepID=A0AAE3MZ75_9HYPH|nr:gephyrin-like molybdotransferase Glp [Ectorhizobium quercum]MCX8997783.1 molybdopterin molybdotransferase MoeA [Ectorhizobium quercum]
MAPLIPVDEALARILGHARPVTQDETVPLTEADGRVLARDLAARLTQPPFDASAMDGYAVRAADAPDGAELAVVGVSAAGASWPRTLEAGQAVRIFTGAPVPAGADSVVIQENTATLRNGLIRVTAAAAPGANIRRRGQDFAEGEVLFTAGTVMDFTRLTLAAAMDHGVLAVRRRPLVAVLATGDELVRPGEPRSPDQIVASSIYGMAAFVKAAGADVLDLGIARDTEADIAAAARRAADAGADVLVTMGGASVGDHDLVQPVLKKIGMELDFWRIAMRPGKPLMVGRLGGMQVLGLPGNPVSTLVCSLLFLEPLIRKLAGLPPVPRLATAVAGADLPANDHRQDYMRARLETGSGGERVVFAAPRQDSSQMKVLARSDCLVIRPPHAPALAAGSPCPVLLIRP